MIDIRLRYFYGAQVTHQRQERSHYKVNFALRRRRGVLLVYSSKKVFEERNAVCPVEW